MYHSKKNGKFAFKHRLYTGEEVATKDAKIQELEAEIASLKQSGKLKDEVISTSQQKDEMYNASKDAEIEFLNMKINELEEGYGVGKFETTVDNVVSQGKGEFGEDKIRASFNEMWGLCKFLSTVLLMHPNAGIPVDPEDASIKNGIMPIKTIVIPSMEELMRLLTAPNLSEKDKEKRQLLINLIN